jgi:hypothetical protein
VCVCHLPATFLPPSCHPVWIGRQLAIPPPAQRLRGTAALEVDALLHRAPCTRVGIKPQDRKLGFKPFYRADKSRSFDHFASVGLGLAITKEIINKWVRPCREQRGASGSCGGGARAEGSGRMDGVQVALDSRWAQTPTSSVAIAAAWQPCWRLPPAATNTDQAWAYRHLLTCRPSLLFVSSGRQVLDAPEPSDVVFENLEAGNLHRVGLWVASWCLKVLLLLW